LGDCLLRQAEVDVLALNRHGLILVFQDFDAQAVRGVDVGLIEPAVVSRRDRHAGGLPLGDLFLHVVDDESSNSHFGI
jgi:hypothetical protein